MYFINLHRNVTNNYHLIRIVGEDDGGELFTPEEYENYKKKVLPKV